MSSFGWLVESDLHNVLGLVPYNVQDSFWCCNKYVSLSAQSAFFVSFLPYVLTRISVVCETWNWAIHMSTCRILFQKWWLELVCHEWGVYVPNIGTEHNRTVCVCVCVNENLMTMSHVSVIMHKDADRSNCDGTFIVQKPNAYNRLNPCAENG